MALKYIVDQIAYQEEMGIFEPVENYNKATQKSGGTGSVESPVRIVDKIEASFNKNVMPDFRSVDKVSEQAEILYYPTSAKQRYIEIMESSRFIFNDHFLKNLLQQIPSTQYRIQFIEKAFNSVNQLNLDLFRRFAWVLSKLYYKKSLSSQNVQNFT